MSETLLSEIESFMADTGLSAHRVGIILARNGMLIPRLRKGGRVWPETEALIRAAIACERRKRCLSEDAA